MSKLISRSDLVDAIFGVGIRLDDPPVKLAEFAERVADCFRLETSPPGAAFASKVKVYDLISEQDYKYPNGKRKARMVGGKVVKRDPATVTHICLHQTAVEFGASDRQVRLSDGDRELALARRFLDVACHAAACRSGFFVKTHPLEDLLNHANGFNDYSVGLEIDGRYPGLEDDPTTAAREDLRTTWGGKPSKLTDQTVEAAREAVRYFVVEGRKLGMPMTHIVAHRQSSPSRRSDPGQGIWQSVVVDFACPELGLTVDLDKTLSGRDGAGLPIPKQWDSRSAADY